MRRLGQHFLKNRAAIEKIVAALDIKDGDTVVEIGPGHGELTEVIEHEARNMKHKIKIIAIERDGGLAEDLRKKFAGNKNIEVVEGDALRVLPGLCSALHDPCFKICGNIPYYITGHLLRIVGELEKKPSLCVFTIQKEVAERIAAAPPRMNRLAASVQFWAEPKIVCGISKKDFQPEPEVESSVIKLASPVARKLEARTYFETVRTLFAQPRKTILGNLASKNRSVGAEKERVAARLRDIGIMPEARPQDLGIEDIEKICSLAL